MSASGSQTIDRAVDLLSRVIQEDRPPTVAELSVASGYARSTTSRLLGALERNHLLRRAPEGGWVPGALFEQYAAQWDRRGQLIRVATPVMDRLGEATGETINLAIGLADAVVQIAQVDSSYILGSQDWVGVDLPPHVSSLGKVLYAHGVLAPSPGPLEQLTESTIGSWDELAGQFPAIRERGWALTVDELEVGLTGIAAPVHDGGRVVAVLGVSGPTARLGDQINTVGTVVAEHAAELSHDLSSSRRKVRHDTR